MLTDLVGRDWKGKWIELSKEDKAAFRADLDGPIYQVTRVGLPLLLLRLDAELSSAGRPTATISFRWNTFCRRRLMRQANG